MGRLLRNILSYKQSILIIVLIIGTLVGCAFVFRHKVNELLVNEIRSNILFHSQSELGIVNKSFTNVVDIMRMASNSLADEQYIGGINTVKAVDSITKVTGFVYIGIADVNGNTQYGFNLSKEEFLNVLPTFHGDPTVTYIPSDNGENYDVIIAIPFTESSKMKYILYVRVTDKELVRYLNKGKTLIKREKDAMSFLIYNLSNVIHINSTTQNRLLPNFTVNVLSDKYNEYNPLKLNQIIDQNPSDIYLFSVGNYPQHYLLIIPTEFEKVDFVMLIPVSVLNNKVNAIMAMYSILCVGIILVLIFLLIYYEYVVNMNRYSIHYLAYIDEFTGLPNKASLREKFVLMYEDLMPKNKLFVAKVEISNHNQISRLYGFSVANKFDLAFAKYISDYPLPNVCVFRVQNYFILLVESEGVELVTKILNSIFEHMYDVELVDQKAIFLAGVTISDNIPKDMSDEYLDLLINNCDIAISVLPHNQKQHAISVFDQSMSDEIHRCDNLEKELEPALKNGEFLVYLQPKYDLVTNKLSGAEALIRWNYKGEGIMPPYKFIPIFEKNGSIALIDDFVFYEVLKLIKKWKSMNLRLIPISVNFSQVQFLNPNLIKDFKYTAEKYSKVFEYVDIEITESATIEDTNHVIEVLREIKKLGFKLSMDDFGTGYSSLSNLSLLPFDTVKLDKSFVDKIDPNDLNSPNVMLIKDVISIIKHFHMLSLVEGVETLEQRDVLRSLGCQYCQGYYYSKPIPVSEFEKLLKQDKVFEDKQL